MYILSTKKIRKFAEEVKRLDGIIWNGHPDPDAIKILLGEILNIWPASIFPGLDEPEEEPEPEPTIS